jgi:hypothetical protein
MSPLRRVSLPLALLLACGEASELRDARWLADDERATLAEWAAQGAPAGDPGIPAPDVPPLPQLAGDVRTAAMPEAYVPDASMPDDYRCFLVDSPAEASGDTYITGFDVRPGDARIVHHVVVFTPTSAEQAAAAAALDAAEAGPGYTCFGAAGVDADVAAAWAPGGGATRFPAGTVHLRHPQPRPDDRPRRGHPRRDVRARPVGHHDFRRRCAQQATPSRILSSPEASRSARIRSSSVTSSPNSSQSRMPTSIAA